MTNAARQLNDFLAIVSHRPHKQKTIEELEKMFKIKTANGSDLAGLIKELGFRRTTRAKRLYRKALRQHLNSQSRS